MPKQILWSSHSPEGEPCKPYAVLAWLTDQEDDDWTVECEYFQGDEENTRRCRLPFSHLHASEEAAKKIVVEACEEAVSRAIRLIKQVLTS
jgi:hypothetical protein